MSRIRKKRNSPLGGGPGGTREESPPKRERSYLSDGGSLHKLLRREDIIQRWGWRSSRELEWVRKSASKKRRKKSRLGALPDKETRRIIRRIYYKEGGKGGYRGQKTDLRLPQAQEKEGLQGARATRCQHGEPYFSGREPMKQRGKRKKPFTSIS